MTDIPEPEQEAPSENDSRIVVIMDGQTSTPKYVDFSQVSPFQMIAIGEWLSLKGRQIVALSEQAGADTPGIITPQIDQQLISSMLEVKP